MNEQMHSQNVFDERRLTKRERRARRRQERDQQTLQGGKKKKTVIWICGIVAAAGVVALVWWLIARGSQPTTTASGLEMMKHDTHNAFLGSKDAAVVVREFSDFQCPACKGSQTLITQMVQTYGDRIKFEYNDYPLVSIHANALFAAEAGQCANDQQKFWPLHDLLFERQSEWDALAKNDAMAKFTQYAQDLGLDAKTFSACLDAGTKRETVQQDINEGDAAKVSATPTFFVNDQQFTGIPTWNQLKSAIDDELAKAATATSPTNTAAINTSGGTSTAR
ncbi:MAG: thioredoxin domain-containing protein [bacterium]